MIPPDQRLRAGKPRNLLLNVELRLIIDQQLFLFNSPPDIIDQPFLKDALFHQVGIINGNGTGIVPPQLVTRLFGPVKPSLRFNIMVDVQVHPDAHAELLQFRQGKHLIHRRKNGIIPFQMLAVDIKIVHPAPADNSVCFRLQFPQGIRDLLEQSVAEFTAVYFIDQVKMLHVQYQCVPFFPSGIVKDLADILEEKLRGIQAGQHIIFRRPDQHPVKGELDDPVTFGQNQFRRLQGFGDEVSDSNADGVQFHLCIRGNDRYRN